MSQRELLTSPHAVPDAVRRQLEVPALTVRDPMNLFFRSALSGLAALALPTASLPGLQPSQDRATSASATSPSQSSADVPEQDQEWGDGGRDRDTVTSDVTEDEGDFGAETLCQFNTRGDRPHLSTTRGYLDTSGHGWWENINCSEGRLADVHITLQALTQNGWYTVDTHEIRTKDRKKGGSRANARVRCVDSRTYTYRSIVDVDVVGVPDDAKKAIIQSNGTLACGFAWN